MDWQIDLRLLPFFCSDSRRHFSKADGRSSVSSYRFVWERLHPFYVQGYAKRLLIFYFFPSYVQFHFLPFYSYLPSQYSPVSVTESSRVSDLTAQGAPEYAGRAQALSALSVQGSSPWEFALLTIPSPSLSPELQAIFTELPSFPSSTVPRASPEGFSMSVHGSSCLQLLRPEIGVFHLPILHTLSQVSESPLGSTFEVYPEFHMSHLYLCPLVTLIMGSHPCSLSIFLFTA